MFLCFCSSKERCESLAQLPGKRVLRGGREAGARRGLGLGGRFVARRARRRRRRMLPRGPRGGHDGGLLRADRRLFVARERDGRLARERDAVLHPLRRGGALGGGGGEACGRSARGRCCLGGLSFVVCEFDHSLVIAREFDWRFLGGGGAALRRGRLFGRVVARALDQRLVIARELDRRLVVARALDRRLLGGVGSWRIIARELDRRLLGLLRPSPQRKIASNSACAEGEETGYFLYHW